MKQATGCSPMAIGLSAAVSMFALTCASFALAQAMTGATTQEQQITTAESAAPSAVSRNATIAVNEAGKLRVLREGSNNWTCLTSFPEAAAQTTGTMAGKPICMDKNGTEWIQAWMEGRDPPKNRIGAAYMLQGVSASATDPFAKGREQGANWIDVGPHVMVLGARGMQEGLSVAAPGEKAVDTHMPFVMWSGTPYEHLMIPIPEHTGMRR